MYALCATIPFKRQCKTGSLEGFSGARWGERRPRSSAYTKVLAAKGSRARMLQTKNLKLVIFHLTFLLFLNLLSFNLPEIYGDCGLELILRELKK